MLSTSGRRISLVLLASLLLSSSTALAGATDQHEDHAIKELIKAGGPATRAANRLKENTATPPGRRHLVDSGDASPRETRNQMEQEYRRQQARRDNIDSSDESYSSSNSDSDESDEECSDDESSDDEDHSTVFFYGKGKTSKSSKSTKSSGKGSNDSGKGSKSGSHSQPTHPSPSKPSCRPKPSSSSDDYWDHVKTSSKGSIYSLADESLCVAFNDDKDILMRDCTNDKDRQWSLMAIAGDSDEDMTYKFITWKKDKDKCITVRGQVKEGSELRMAKCDKEEKFLWKFNEGNQWRPKADLGLCVDLDKVREGTRPTLEDCGDTRRQRWDVGKGDDSSPSRPGSRPTPRPTQDPATCSVDRTCGRPRRPI